MGKVYYLVNYTMSSHKGAPTYPHGCKMYEFEDGNTTPLECYNKAKEDLQCKNYDIAGIPWYNIFITNIQVIKH